MGIIVLINILLSMLNFKNVTVTFCLHRFFFWLFKNLHYFLFASFLFIIHVYGGNNTKESYHFLN